MASEDPQPRLFETPEAFRRWFEEHHESAQVLWVGLNRKAAGLPSMTWPESVDGALCFGWIDGLGKRIDDASRMLRFTPRRPDSNWSGANIRRIRGLIAEGRVRRAGLAAFEGRTSERSRTYSYEARDRAEPDPELAARFRAEGGREAVP